MPFRGIKQDRRDGRGKKMTPEDSIFKEGKMRVNLKIPLHLHSSKVSRRLIQDSHISEIHG
jgi:hypothetical protein